MIERGLLLKIVVVLWRRVIIKKGTSLCLIRTWGSSVLGGCFIVQSMAQYCDKILSMERAAPKSWSEFTTDKLKSEKLIK